MTDHHLPHSNDGPMRRQGSSEHPDQSRPRDSFHDGSGSPPNPLREKSSHEIAREILQRRLGEDRSADRQAEARLGNRERALEVHYRERGY